MKLLTALLIVSSLVCVLGGCKKATKSSATSPGAAAPESEIRTAILAHLAHRRTLNLQAFDTEVKQVTFQGDRAQAQVDFQVKNGPGKMQLTYHLERNNGSWIVTEGNPVGSNFPHPALGSSALAQETDRVSLVGSGSGAEPQGIFYASNVQEIDAYNDTSPASGVPTDYGWLSHAVQAARTYNVEPGDFIMAPRTAGDLDRLSDTTGQPLSPPRSVGERQFLTTSQVPITQTDDASPATYSDGSSIFIGQWSDLLIGMRTHVTLEASRTAESAFKALQVMIRAYMRMDVQLARAPHFVRIVGVRS